MRRVILAVAVTALFAGPTALSFFSGGYFAPARLAAATVAWLLVLAAALLAPRPLPRSPAARVALGGLALLAVWTALSFAWSPLDAPTADALQRDLLYLGALAAATALLRGHAIRRLAEPALAAGTLVVIGYGLSERLLPGVIHLSHAALAAGRLEQPLTYWNTTGALAAVGATLAARVAGDATRAAWLRGAAAAAVAPLAVGVWLSFSRGALAATGIGAMALVALAPTRAQLRALVLVAIAAAPAVVAANAFDGVRALEGAQSAREADGAAMLAILAACCAAAALVSWLLARAELRGRLRAEGWALPQWAAPAAAATIVLAVAAVVGFTARSGGKPAATGATAARVTSLESNRYAYWRVAFRDGFAHHPVRGTGPGGFQVLWLEHRKIRESALFAHSLYVGTLTELGLVGFVLLLALLGGVLAGGLRACRDAPVLVAGPLAAFVVWMVHSALDWDWEMPALTLTAVVLAGLLLAADDERAAAAPATAAEQPAAAGVPVGV